MYTMYTDPKPIFYFSGEQEAQRA